MNTVSPQSFSRPKYRPDIDGMRALAILSVLIFHAYPSSLPGGFVGVDIFFVISGYLISSIIFRGLTLGTFSFFDFYARRVRRIFPAVSAVIVGSFILGYFLLPPYVLEELIEESPYAAFFVENWRLYVTTGDYWGTATELQPFMHFWSLGVEEQYYIFYPLICFLLWKVSAKRFLASLLLMLGISFCLCLYDTANEPVRAFYSLHTRFWELLIGGVLAYVELKWPQYKSSFNSKVLNNALSISGVFFILIAIFWFNENENFPGWRALFPVVGSVLIIAAGQENYINRYIFSNKLAVFVGLISYPLYLWHWSLICIARNNLAGNQPDGLLMIILIALSFALAYLTYILIERPMRSRKASWSLVLVLFVLLALISLGTKTALRKFDTLQNWLYSGLSTEVQNTLKELPRSEQRDQNCEKVFGKGYSVCRATTKNPSILIFGDSHSHIMWNYMYKQNQLPGLYMVGIGGTVFFDKTMIIDPNNSSGGVYKMNLMSNVWKSIRSNPDIKTIVLRGYWSGNYRSNLYSFKHPDLKGKELYLQLWQDTLSELNQLNKRVVIVLDNIDVPFNPLTKCSKVERFSLLSKENTDCVVNYDEVNPDDFWIRDYLYSQSQKWNNVEIVDAWDALCDDQGCYLSKNGVPYYRDGNHLSVYGNEKVWKLIEKTLNSSHHLEEIKK